MPDHLTLRIALWGLPCGTIVFQTRPLSLVTGATYNQSSHFGLSVTLRERDAGCVFKACDQPVNRLNFQAARIGRGHQSFLPDSSHGSLSHPTAVLFLITQFQHRNKVSSRQHCVTNSARPLHWLRHFLPLFRGTSHESLGVTHQPLRIGRSTRLLRLRETHRVHYFRPV